MDQLSRRLHHFSRGPKGPGFSFLSRKILMIHRGPLIAAITLFASTVASAQGLDGLYFQMKFAFGQLQESHYFFTPDGRYLNDVPNGTLDAAGMERACAKSRDSCGKYRVTGSQLILTPNRGVPETLEIERIADGNLNIGGRFAKHVEKFPTGTKLDGKYSRSAGAGAVSAASTFTFKPDGTFSATSLGAVATQQGVGKSESAAHGTYRLAGNTLELSSDAGSKKIVAYAYDLGKGDVRLNLDGVFYKKQ